MYKLKHELPKEFKIKVNPEQSEALQKHLFSIGYSWGIGDTEIEYTDRPYLYLSIEIGLQNGFTESVFKKDELKRIKFKDYFEKVEELPEKWCILVTEDNYQELNTWMHRNWKNYSRYKDSWSISKVDIGQYFHNDLFDAPLISFKANNSTLITTEQFRTKYGDLKSKNTENYGVLPLEIKRLQLENEQLKKYNEDLSDQVGMYYKQVLMLTEKLETIKKVLE